MLPEFRERFFRYFLRNFLHFLAYQNQLLSVFSIFSFAMKDDTAPRYDFRLFARKKNRFTFAIHRPPAECFKREPEEVTQQYDNSNFFPFLAIFPSVLGWNLLWARIGVDFPRDSFTHTARSRLILRFTQKKNVSFFPYMFESLFCVPI